jgi:hypothetical protein
LSYVPFGTHYLINFLQSYQNQDAGINHNLIILFNGYHNEKDLHPFIEILNTSLVSYQIIITESKYDIDAYFYIAELLKNSEYVTFLNTYSVILHANWLKYFYANIIKESVGCVSATGAWGDYFHAMEYKKSINKIKKFKGSLTDVKKVIYFRFNFYPTVRPHLRTNGFMINRLLFLSIKRPSVRPVFLNLLLKLNSKKIRSFCFEHGKDSFSQQLVDRGLQIQIVNKFGSGLNINEWPASNVYWNGLQENLLIQDNQTSKYQKADIEERKRLAYAAWGIM